ncbi:hypothetical protein A2397_03260 [Candidatus Amesbacteria bacterium RIFOXYB1_FULL_44_23]|uniref:Uncharacterized protein n=1 Tax=Candidatus Amesbacteria bacterium RIFOXYB1_FULL_44_23 TaxID=1797263 RepID=A0A1F4ZXN7_9BACT|nr:MAG: hypothetical protein A2397_03260 [Candidatus Amesbacteria bacterium RIFOXYB1_FULL_44_23]
MGDTTGLLPKQKTPPANDNQLPSATNPGQSGSNSQAGGFQAMYGQGGKFKEQLEAIAGTFGGKSGGVEVEPPTAETSKSKLPEAMQEIVTVPELEKKPELSGYIEKVEQATDKIAPITDDYTHQVLLKSADPTAVKVTLPLTEDEVEKGLHHKVWESIRWLSEWCVRQFKLLRGRAEYKKVMPNDS